MVDNVIERMLNRSIMRKGMIVSKRRTLYLKKDEDMNDEKYIEKLENRVVKLEEALRKASRYIGANLYSSQNAWDLKCSFEKLLNE